MKKSGSNLNWDDSGRSSFFSGSGSFFSNQIGLFCIFACNQLISNWLKSGQILGELNGEFFQETFRYFSDNKILTGW